MTGQELLEKLQGMSEEQRQLRVLVRDEKMFTEATALVSVPIRWAPGRPKKYARPAGGLSADERALVLNAGNMR